MMDEELQSESDKLRSVKQINEDLKNLLESTEIGIVCIDQELNIKRYNSSAQALFNFVELDLGRPLSDITHKFQYDELNEDVIQVFDELKPVKKQVTTENNHWYILWINPYTATEHSFDYAVLTFVDITDLKRELEEKVKTQNQLQNEILNIEKKERWRIGQYLHDDTAQKLVGAKMLMGSILPQIKHADEQTSKQAEKIKTIIDESLENIRELSHFVLPIKIGKGGVSSAFQKLVKQTEDLYKIECTFTSDSTVDDLEDHTTASYLYYIAQEAIRNGINHGKADEIKVDLYSDNTYLYLTVEDNGEGLKDTDQDTGMGINIMRYRADLIGGTLEIKELPEDEGTILKCYIPLDRIKE